MKRWERWSFNALNVVVAVTGVLYFWMKYLLRDEDPFAVVNHPWQSQMLALHVVAAPLLMMAFGVVFRAHVLAKLTSNGQRARRTGWTSVLSFAVMAVSGYLLQVVSSPDGLRVLTAVHVGSGAVFAGGYSAHLVIGWYLASPRLARAAARVEPGAVHPS